MAEYTTFAGLYALDPGDPISLNNYEFYGNEFVLDNYLNAFINHVHDGSPAMADFASGPTLTASASGGILPPSQTYYIGITAMDRYGGETNVAFASATTPATVVNPTVAPTTIPSLGGTLNAGGYRYGYTLFDANGETEISPQRNVRVSANGKVTLGLPNTGSVGKRVYRAYGYSDFKKVTDVAGSSTSVIDDGTLCVSCDQEPPDENTAGMTNSINIIRPSLPASAVSWRVYVGPDESFPSPAALHAYGSAFLREIASAASSVLFTSEGAIAVGAPPSVSRTIPGASLIFATDIFYAGDASGNSSGSVESALDSLFALASAESGLEFEKIRSLRSSPNPLASSVMGNVVLSVGSGMTISQQPNSSSGSAASGTFTFSASRFRSGTGSYSFGDMTFNGANATGDASGTTISVSGSAITIAGQRIAFGSAAAPNYNEARDHWATASGSGTTILETSTGGNDYRFDIRASRITASAGPPTYLGHRDVFLKSNAQVTISETASAGGTAINFAVNSLVVGTFAAPVSFTPNFPSDSGKMYMASGITIILPSGAQDSNEIVVKKIAAGAGTAITVTASGTERLEGTLGGSVAVVAANLDSLTIRYSTAAPGYWLV